MSAVEILAELPNLTDEERSTIRLRLRELDARDEAELLQASNSETEAAWKCETDRRIEEIQAGKVQGIPAEEVFAKARQMLGR